MNTSKFIGCIMIVIGTTVGAGMLELQTVSASAGFTLASILMLVMWLLSIVTGLMIIEVNLALPSHACSFSSMAERTIGIFWKVITWISYLFLLYSITWGYIAGGTSLITSTIEHVFHVKTPSWISAVSFTAILGSSVFLGAKIVDYFNRSLISIKGVLLLVTLVLVLPHIDLNKLVAVQNIGQTKYLWIAAPIFMLSFYHSVIPSLRIYIGDKPHELKRIVIYGATISLIVYLLWLAATLGTVPLVGDNSFTSLAQSKGSVGELFVQTMAAIINNKWITSSISCFASIAMTTSFLGVTLGLFDFLADGFKVPNTQSGRLKTAGLTFLPPLIFAILYPKGFALALYCAATFIALMMFILPPFMVYRLRKNPKLKSPYRVFGGNTLLVLVLIIGIILLVLPILSNLHLLPDIKI